MTCREMMYLMDSRTHVQKRLGSPDQHTSEENYVHTSEPIMLAPH